MIFSKISKQSPYFGDLWTFFQIATSLGRRTAYSMMGVGLHGQEGVGPATALRMIKIWVTPRLLHGLESAVLKKSHLHKLDRYYKRLLRQVQGLPTNTATEAVYLMIGALPVEALLHKKIFSQIGAIGRLPQDDPLKEIAIRQLACRDSGGGSWFAQAIRLGEKYGVDVHSAIKHGWPKMTWKRHINLCISDHWWLELKRTAAGKKTLRWLLLGSQGVPHQLWTTCTSQNFHTQAATIRAKMLVGRYLLQTDRAKFAGG